MDGLPLSLGIVLILSGCWAQFPDERMAPDHGLKGPTDASVTDVVQIHDLPVWDKSAPDQAVLDLPRIDAATCPAACSSCSNNVCTLSSCATGCTCPAGWSCVLSCSSNGCQGDVDCSQGKNCTIDCSSDSCSGNITCGSGDCTVTCTQSSCGGNITCGAGPCTIACSQGSCTSNINCAKSCGCSVDCKQSSCAGNITCPSACTGCEPKDKCDNCP